MKLHELKPAEGSTRVRRRVGRGIGSGMGKQSTRGAKGQNARTGGGVRPGFEGGQMPLYRRLPKRGFKNIFADEFAIVNVESLNCFEDNAVVDPATLVEAGILKNVRDGVRVLGNGELKKALTVRAQGFTKSAQQKIEAAGGKAEVIWNMGSAFANIFANKELKDRILFTFVMFVIFRLGVHIPVPGVDSSVIESLFTSGNIFGFLDLFSGGALSKFSLFAMSITPYINSSIIMQLLTAVIPTLEEWQKDGQEGYKKIQKVTRYFTVVLAFIQAFGMAYALRANNALLDNSWFFLFFIVIVLTAGTCLLVWIGEQITEKGIGNGISLIIFCGIVARFPEAASTIVDYLKVGTITPLQALLFVVIGLAMILVVIAVNEAQRRIPVQYAKRVVGRKMYGGHSTFLPLKVNQAGVIPIIFASSIIMMPVTLAQFVHINWVKSLATLFGWGTWPNTILYGILIFMFTYFYTAITVNVKDLADNMKKYGGFIPGIRPGEPTMMYIDKVLTRITLTGAIFLAFVAILPNFIGNITGIQGVYFGGTALLIVVGVALETMRQAQSLMVTRNYRGFLK